MIRIATNDNNTVLYQNGDEYWVVLEIGSVKVFDNYNDAVVYYLVN